MKAAVYFGPDEHVAVAQLLHEFAEHGTESPEAISLLAQVAAEFDIERIIYCLVDMLVITIEALADGDPRDLIDEFNRLANNQAGRYPNGVT